MKLIRLIPLLVLYIAVGCQKNNSNPTINNGPLLKTYTETVASSLTDTNFIIHYYYDNRNRVQSSMKTNYVLLLINGALLNRYDSTVYFYNGDQELPYQVKTLFYNNTRVKIAEENTYYSFDASGFLINDSSFIQSSSSTAQMVVKYKYLKDTVWRLSAGNTLTTAYSKDSMKSRIQICGNNICNQYDTLYHYPDLFSVYSRTIKITLDNSYNPFYAVKMRLPVWDLNRFHFFSDSYGFFNNNITGISYNASFPSSSAIDTYSNTYIRNSANMPEKVSFYRVQQFSPAAVYKYTGYFSYY